MNIRRSYHTYCIKEYFPIPHAVQAAEPVVFFHVPTAHAVHVPPSGPVCPTLQVQEVATELGLGELELVGHTIHAVPVVAPTVVEYVPAVQLVHVVLAVAPVAVEYSPAAQSAHAAVPVTILYLPATQAGHVLPSGPV
jgi:hypothetical protein